MSSLAAGTLVKNRYRIERALASGGNGTVYEAHDELLDQRVALKVVAHEGLRREEFETRFRREARIGNLLGKQRGFVRVIEWGALGDGVRLFLAMDLVADAKPLDLLTGRLEERLERLAAAARLVRDAHAAGVVHRDLKPQNFLQAPDGSIWLTDFGLAKGGPEADESPGAGTLSGTGNGTPLFRAPEQYADFKHADARADVYSLGVMLFVALTGAYPFGDVDSDHLAIALQHKEIELGMVTARPRPIDRGADVPAALDELCARALALRPEHRVPSARAFLEGLEAASRPGARAPNATPGVSIGVAPLAEGEEDREGFEPVLEWERFVAERRTGAPVSVQRLAPRPFKGELLEAASDKALVSAVAAELGGDGPLRASVVFWDRRWALVLRRARDAALAGWDEPGWETSPEPDGKIWSAPRARDAEELREALARFQVCDQRVAGDAKAAHARALDVLARVGVATPAAAAPVVQCAACGARVAARDLATPFRCPECQGELASFRFGRSWVSTAAGGQVPRSQREDYQVVASAADMVAQVVRQVSELAGRPRCIAIVVCTSAEKLDEVERRLRLGGMIRLARGTADAVVAGSAELERGEATCLLLDPGTAGPSYELPMARYPGEKKVFVLDPERMTRKAFDRVEAITRASHV